VGFDGWEDCVLLVKIFFALVVFYFLFFFFGGGGGGGGGEVTDCKLNLLGMTSRFCTLTIFVVNLL